MPTASGKIRVAATETTTTLTITTAGDPPTVKVFGNPPEWVWDLVRGNAGATGDVTFTVGPPESILAVAVS